VVTGNRCPRVTQVADGGSRHILGGIAPEDVGRPRLPTGADIRRQRDGQGENGPIVHAGVVARKQRTVSAKLEPRFEPGAHGREGARPQPPVRVQVALQPPAGGIARCLAHEESQPPGPGASPQIAAPSDDLEVGERVGEEEVGGAPNAADRVISSSRHQALGVQVDEVAQASWLADDRTPRT
jgi:hypothetical protein